MGVQEQLPPSTENANPCVRPTAVPERAAEDRLSIPHSGRSLVCLSEGQVVRFGYREVHKDADLCDDFLVYPGN